MFEQVWIRTWMQIQSVRVYTWSEQRIKHETCISICIYVCTLYVHFTFMYVHGSSLFILLNVCKWFISVHPGSPVSAQENIAWRYAVRTSCVLGCTSFRQCYRTGIGPLVQIQFIEVCTP
jgi:hypothetical protein